MKKVKPRFFFALTLIIAGGATAGVFWLKKSKRESYKLADGTEAIIEKIEFGNSAQLVTRLPDWKKKMRMHLPLRFRSWISPATTPPIGLPEDQLTIWLSNYDPKKGKWLARRWLGNAKVVELVDDHGCVFKAGGFTTDTMDDKPVAALFFKYFPRRPKTFKIRISQNQQVLGEIVVENPAAKAYPEWTPQELPAEVTVGNSILRISKTDKERPHSFHSRDDYYEINHGLGGGLGQYYNLSGKNYVTSFPFVFEAYRNGKWEPAVVKVVTYSDAMGNDAPYICRRERAWKMTATLVAQGQDGLSDPEAWHLRDLPIPRPGEFIAIGKSNTWSGAFFQLIGVTGAGDYTFVKDKCVRAGHLPAPLSDAPEPEDEGEVKETPSLQFTSSEPHLIFRAIAEGNDQNFIISIKEDPKHTTDFTVHCEITKARGLDSLSLRLDTTKIDMVVRKRTNLKVSLFVEPPSL